MRLQLLSSTRLSEPFQGFTHQKRDFVRLRKYDLYHYYYTIKTPKNVFFTPYFSPPVVVSKR